MRKNIGFLKNDKKKNYWDKNLEKLEKRENQKNLQKQTFPKTLVKLTLTYKSTYKSA